MDDFPSPPHPDQLASFPSRTLKAGRSIFRLHHRDLGPFWFASTPEDSEGGNRFDLAAPEGASYWALQPVVSVLETLARRPIRTLPSDLLERYALCEATLPDDLDKIANVPVKAARRFGLTAEIHTTDNRNLTRSWAQAWFAAGFRAVIALPRHDVTGRHRTLTLWGPQGEHQPYGWTWHVTTGPVGSVVDDLDRWGIRVMPIPFEVETIRPDTASNP